jgi:hypothetical protein
MRNPNQHPILAAGMLGLVVGLVMAAVPARSQPSATAQAAIASAPQIKAEIQRQIAEIVQAGGNAKMINGVSPNLVGTTDQQQEFVSSYCYLVAVSPSNPAYVTVVFTDGTYFYATNPAIFPQMATACPTATKLKLNFTATVGSTYTWTNFFVLHN